MCTYCGTTKYRKIYENHTGIIPTESDGRTYEIHHIDGNHSNNNPSNLKAVTLQEHYAMHYTHGDWAACLLMSDRMKLSPTEKSNIASLQNQYMVEIGKHNFLGGEIQRKSNQARIKKGTHHLIGPAHNQNRVSNGTHNFVGGELQRSRVKDGTHPFLGGEVSRKTNQDRVSNGTHNFLGGENNKRRLDNGDHNFIKQYICVHCGKQGKGPMMFRWHFDNCQVFKQ